MAHLKLALISCAVFTTLLCNSTVRAQSRPSEVVVPAVPAIPDKPPLPVAEPPTKSLLLQQAYRMMQDANPYQYDQAQEMLRAGMAEQSEMDEHAAARRQAVRDMQYQIDAQNYSAALNANRASQDSAHFAALFQNIKSIEAVQTERSRRADAATQHSYNRSNTVRQGAITWSNVTATQYGRKLHSPVRQTKQK
jgi:hypothetical protein